MAGMRLSARADYALRAAIELAAARCPSLGPAELAARLDGHPGLLSGGPARPGRHRSLEALVAWSYDLLDDAERRLLVRLSVLRGGFDLGTAERVAAGGTACGGAVFGRAFPERQGGRIHIVLPEGRLEAWAGIEPAYADLQSAASPLCHQAAQGAAAAIPTACNMGQAATLSPLTLLWAAASINRATSRGRG